MHFIAASPWRWQQERVSLGDAPWGMLPMGSRPQPGVPGSSGTGNRAPCCLSAQHPSTWPHLSRFGKSGRQKPSRELAVPSRWGRSPQGCEPLCSLGSDGAKIKAMCVAWVKVYGNKQLPELRDGSGNDLMYYAASWGESMAELSRVQRPPQNLLTAMVRYLCLNCLLDTMLQTRNDLFSLLGSKTWMVISPPL